VENDTTIAVDIAKSVFEIAVSEERGRVCERQRLSRSQMLAFFARRPSATVLLEACGSAHPLGRILQGFGHRVLLLPPAQVRRYVLRDKTDRTDAKALLEAHRNDQIVPVPVKTVLQHTLASVHRLRSGWMGSRTARLNTLRGLLREFDVTIPVGAKRVVPSISLAVSSGKVPEVLHPILTLAGAEILELEKRINEAERLLKRLAKELPAAPRILSVPGIGLLGATALIASIGEPSRFRSGRQLASFLGLVPREYSSGNRRFLGSITKRGEPYLRTLFTHGARSVLLAASKRKHNDRLRTWALDLQKRRGHNRATIALANKMTRIVWAVWSKNTRYQSATSEETL
jgi:transposase